MHVVFRESHGLEESGTPTDLGQTPGDLVVLSGDPLSVYTHVLETWVEGERIFDRCDPDQELWATGGYGVYHSGGVLHEE